MTLRICMVCGFRPTEGGGGTEKHVFELVTGLLQRGAKVDVVCEDRSFLPDPDNRLAQHIAGVNSSSLHAEGWVEIYLEKSRRFAGIVNPDEYDIVHCHSHYGFDTALKLAPLRERPALISTFHLTPQGSLERFANLGFEEPEGAPIDRAVGIMERAQAQLSDCCIAVSKGVAREVVDFYDVPEDRVRTLYNWFDRRLFYPHDPQTARANLGLDPARRCALYIGHFGDFRGWLLRDALRLLPDDVQLIVIHPEADNDVQQEFGERVLFAGYVEPESMSLYYSAADLQCFPTVYGAFGLVLIEGMACGCPPVVFDYPAMNELVHPECGYLVEEATPGAYASAIESAFATCSNKREAAIAQAARFDMDSQIDRVVQLYEEVIDRRRVAQPIVRGKGTKAFEPIPR